MTHPPRWHVLIDDHDRIIPLSAEAPDPSAGDGNGVPIGRYQVVSHADGSLDLVAVEYFEDKLALARPDAAPMQRKSEAEADVIEPFAHERDDEVIAPEFTADEPVALPILVGQRLPEDEVPTRTLENRLHAGPEALALTPSTRPASSQAPAPVAYPAPAGRAIAGHPLVLNPRATTGSSAQRRTAPAQRRAADAGSERT